MTCSRHGRTYADREGGAEQRDQPDGPLREPPCGSMFTLTRVFQSLAQRKPALDAGVSALVSGWISLSTRSSCKQSRTAPMSLPSE